jgi:hypothetical protein
VRIRQFAQLVGGQILTHGFSKAKRCLGLRDKFANIISRARMLNRLVFR